MEREVWYITHLVLMLELHKHWAEVIITQVHRSEVFGTWIYGCLFKTAWLNVITCNGSTNVHSKCSTFNFLAPVVNFEASEQWFEVKTCTVFTSLLTFNFSPVAFSRAPASFCFFSGLISASSFACFSLSRAVCSFWQDLWYAALTFSSWKQWKNDHMKK